MFFQGTLQEGIAAALQQAKTVVCFVTDGGDESKQWEEELLTDESVKPLLESEAVVLRLEAGSEGEGFLSQLYPIPKKPTLVIIKNAELKEYVAAGVSREDFFSRLQKALQPTAPPAQPAPQAVPSTQTQSPSASASASQGASTGQTAPSSSNANDSNAAHIQAVLAERAARLEAKRKKDAEEARRQRIEKDKAKARELAANPEKKSEPQNKYAEQIRKQKRQAQEERARILKAIEDDKAARRARQAERTAERRAASETPDAPFAPASQLLPSSGRLSEHCALQVRLLDGSTIRTKFSSKDTLAKDVREWVDESRTDGKTPYTFKVLLTPLPNKTIDVTEEGKSLQELGLAPNATLIILPVKKSVAAYEGNSEGNIISRAIAYILSWITGFFGIIATFFSTLFSTAGPPQAPEGQAPASDRAQGRTTGRDDQGNRVKGLRPEEERRRRDQQFYNGNSTNFEPNYDEEDQ